MSNLKRVAITLVPLGDPAAFEARHVLAGVDEPGLTLAELLAEMPALALEPIPAAMMAIPVARLNIAVADAVADRALYCPPGVVLAGHAAVPATAPETTSLPTGGGARPGAGHPAEMDEASAALLAYDEEIRRAAAYVDSGLSVLVRCDKLLVEHLATEIARRSGRTVRLVQASAADDARTLPGLAGPRRMELLAALQDAVRNAKEDADGGRIRGDVVVVPHLDLLAGGNDAALSAEARELTDALYERSRCVLLGFVDPSLTVPEVLANRFAVRLAVEILPRELSTRDGDRVPVGQALVTAEEAALFAGFDPVALYKHVAGMNAVRLRHAIRYAHHQHRHAGATFAQLLAEVRTFKAVTSGAFEVPDVSFDEIGGYAAVKEEMARALRLIGRADELPDSLRHDLLPRGFIFHGPPGTGKTLFAKAVATALAATILVVSGPEITDMYVGESERKIREIFAEARRNAPAVVVFDEFDSIASRRTGRADSGSRAGNAIVAQLLAEMDGFRPEVPLLVIGTTNRLDIIDDALLRPSRFKPVRVDLPEEHARREIARVHATRFGVDVSEALLDRIARATHGMNGDEIRSVFRDARADELIGDPPRPADARRLGELVGRLRLSTQGRDLARGPALRPRPGAARTPMTVVVTSEETPAP